MSKHEPVRTVEEGRRRRTSIGRWALIIAGTLLAVGLVAATAATLIARASTGPPQPGPSIVPSPSASPSPSPTTPPPSPSPSESPSPSPSPTSTPPANPGDDDKATLRIGMHGKAVKGVQRRLTDLGYTLTDIDGEFGDDTLHAVLAFQKVEGLGRDGVVGPVTRKKLAHAERPAPRSRTTALHVEIDIARQVLFFVEHNKVTDVYDVSSGSDQPYTNEGQTHIAHTPRGSFHIDRKIDGWRESSLGMLYRPAYFYGGYAIHGSSSVPAYPASHGCVRVTLHVMDHIYDRLAVGTPVVVYG